MSLQRSKGVTFWGNLYIVLGIIYAIINSARNIWRIDYIGLPIFFVVIGSGILCRKNWARISLMVFSVLLLLSAALTLPQFLQSIKELSKSGPAWFLIAVGAFSLRFILGISVLIFFTRPSVKAQFKKEVKS